MWVIRYDGERAINLEKVRSLRLEPRSGEVLLLADFDCDGETELLAHGDPNAMYRLLEDLVRGHKGPTRVGVFDIGKWAIHQNRVEGLSKLPIEVEEVGS